MLSPCPFLGPHCGSGPYLTHPSQHARTHAARNLHLRVQRSAGAARAGWLARGRHYARLCARLLLLLLPALLCAVFGSPEQRTSLGADAEEGDLGPVLHWSAIALFAPPSSGGRPREGTGRVGYLVSPLSHSGAGRRGPGEMVAVNADNG